MFWKRYQHILCWQCIEERDVAQQAALIVAEQEEGQLWVRLIDWMRKVSHFDHHQRTLPKMISFEAWHGGTQKDTTRIDPLTPQDNSRKYLKSHLEQDALNVDAVNVARRAFEEAEKLKGRYPEMIRRYLDGQDQRQIATALRMTEGNITRMMKRLLTPLMMCAVLLIPVFAYAQEDVNGCVAVTWDANTEPDLMGYNLRRKDLTVPASTTVFIDKAMTSIACASLGLVVGHTYEIALNAQDTSLNQSAYTTITFNWVPLDVIPPDAPISFCLQGSLNGVDKQICAVITSSPSSALRFNAPTY